MKVKAEAFINSKRSINFDKILITGSDEAFVSYVKNHIIQDFKNRNYFIDFSNNYTTNSMGGLFSENKTLFVLSDFPTDMENDKTKMHGQCILVALLNGKKTNAILLQLKSKKQIIGLKNQLSKKKIYIRSGFQKPIDKYVRISLCSKKKLKIFFNHYMSWKKNKFK